MQRDATTRRAATATAPQRSIRPRFPPSAGKAEPTRPENSPRARGDRPGDFP